MTPPRTRRAASPAARAKGVTPALNALLDELEGRADDLAERMLERYLAAIPTYRSMPDETLRQVREVNKRNIRGFIRAMRRGRF